MATAANLPALLEVFEGASGEQMNALQEYARAQNETNVYVREIIKAFEEYKLRKGGASRVAHESDQSQLKEEEDEWT